MDTDTARIFNESFKRCQRSDDFFERFYQKYLESSDEVKEKFKNTDMEKQARLLEQSFYTIKLVYSGNELIIEKVKELGKLHGKRNLDIRPELYTLWLDILIDTVREKDSQFSHEVEVAWCKVLVPGISYMIEQYDQ